MLLKYGLLGLAYLLGSIPFSIILGVKLRGIDIRKYGSKNPGGTNSVRFLGKKIGFTIMFLDGLKAGLIVLLVKYGVFGDVDLLHPLAYGVAAAFGHVYSIYIKFKGGKAVATTVGMSIAFNIYYALIMMVVFFIVLRIWKYVSVSSSSAALTGAIIGLVVGFTSGVWDIALFYGILLLLILYRHKGNFQNIKNNVEPKVTVFDKKSKLV